MRPAPIDRPQYAARVRGDPQARGDQGFESGSLQQRVTNEPAAQSQARKRQRQGRGEAKPDENYTQHVPAIARTMSAWRYSAISARGASTSARANSMRFRPERSLEQSAQRDPGYKNHKGGYRAFSKRVQPVRCRPRSAVLKRRKRRRTPLRERQFRLLHSAFTRHRRRKAIPPRVSSV
jgi:hypothetical protein